MERLFQLQAAIATPPELPFHVGERRVRRQNVQVVAGVPAEGPHLGPGAREEVSHGVAHVLYIDAQRQGGVSRGIAIDQQDALLGEQGQTRTHIDRRGGFPGAPL